MRVSRGSVLRFLERDNAPGYLRLKRSGGVAVDCKWDTMTLNS